ncbi:MAG: Undecaprenyl-phosphate galactose phosphotransferase [Candidatus Daviesbacteria bacterium GW2011_GWA2_42_7]|uniref:Undecaprenyl-phosphate galactose phosphotransferase n=1 Tax=Candidatus Daviesbacteria bacterium GW2011_GWA2_42_7 TaxID=1618425 RepID=A0A0G1BBI4_9BACT|nr:MAG: Undecaprenyl-phosphate galactose phosphotransferase [Candidatus Daviesbacteria bacterium GW2011_GWA2_42_7]
MTYIFFKRALDLMGSVLGIILSLPVMLVTVLLIKLDSPGPIFADTPMRVGRNGKLFKMYKFRSMVVGAHDMLQKDPQLLKQYKQNSYKIQDDPRVTRVGKFIRKVSIDELPQLFNIVKGEMSLVGPRAYYPFELEEQQEEYPQTEKFVKIILQAKPGLTGVWQTSGRSEINFDKRVQMDATYVERKSIIFDILLVLKTIPAVLARRGAV